MYEFKLPLQLKQLSNIIQYIPYPLIVLFEYDGKICLNVSPKRINKNDSTKLVVEESYFTDWIDLESMAKLENDFIASLSIQNHPFTDFFSFYNSYLDRIIAFNASEYTGDLSSSDDTKELLEKIREVEAHINDTVSKIKKETSLKDKVNMNIELKKLNDTLSELKSSI